MRKHPFKVFILVIMPLLTGGALTKILAQFGVRLPRGLEQLVGGGGSRGGMGGYQNERYYARGGARDFGTGSSLPGMGGGMGDNLQGLLKVAKMFMWTTMDEIERRSSERAEKMLDTDKIRVYLGVILDMNIHVLFGDNYSRLVELMLLVGYPKYIPTRTHFSNGDIKYSAPHQQQMK
jgi:hypothetical protein